MDLGIERPCLNLFGLRWWLLLGLKEVRTKSELGLSKMEKFSQT